MADDYRKLIRQLAGSPKIAAANHRIAQQVATEARRIDPHGDFSVEDTELVVNGLARRVSVVRNDADDAARVEFGRQSGREASDGRGGLRPLGRAARIVGGS